MIPYEQASPQLRRQRDAIAAGLCTYLCGRNARPGRRTCTTCGKKDAERGKARYADAVAVDRRWYNLQASQRYARRKARRRASVAGPR